MGARMSKRAAESHLSPCAPPYLLGTDAKEFERLKAQHQVWSSATSRLWDLAKFGPGSRLLDLGCGPGFAAIELADRVGAEGGVLAVDESERFIDSLVCEGTRLGLSQLTARVERVETLTLVPESLNGVFARWLFCFLPDPAAVVARVVPGLCAGGRFVVQDYLNYRATTLQPRGPAFDRVIRAVEASWRRTGAALDIGGRLPRLLAEHDCRVRQLVPLVHYATPGTPFWEWPKRFFFGYVPRLVTEGLLTEAERSAFEDEWAQREGEPGSFLSLPPMVGIVAEKVRRR